MPNRRVGTRSDSPLRSSFGIRHSAFGILAVLGTVAVLGSAGCFPKPNQANIALRKQVQTLEAKVNVAEAQHAADRAQIDALSADRTIQTLPSEKMDRLFKTSALKFKKLLIGEDLDPNTPGDEGFKIGVVPLDQAGDEFKAAGSFKIELFDLADQNTRLGTWTIDTPDAQKRWMSSLVFDGYVLQLPWQTPPTHAKLLVKATFTEELTGRSFEATGELTVNPPQAKSATQP